MNSEQLEQCVVAVDFGKRANVLANGAIDMVYVAGVRLEHEDIDWSADLKSLKAMLLESPLPPVGHQSSVGTVKWFNETRGYGFIEPHDGSEDVFVHVTHVQKAGAEKAVVWEDCGYRPNYNPKKKDMKPGILSCSEW